MPDAKPDRPMEPDPTVLQRRSFASDDAFVEAYWFALGAFGQAFCPLEDVRILWRRDEEREGRKEPLPFFPPPTD